MPAGKSTHVFVIDHDEQVRILLGQALAVYGFQVTVASDVVEAARNRGNNSDFDLILMDVGPEQRPLILLKRLMPNVPFCLMSAGTLPKDSWHSLGASCLFRKPFASLYGLACVLHAHAESTLHVN